MTKRQELRARRQRESRQRQLYIIGGIVVVAVAIVGWLAYQNFRPIGTFKSVESTPPPNADGSAIGSADAKVVLQIFEDFQCPICRRFTQDIEPRILNDYVYTGKVRYDFRHFIVIDGNKGGNESQRAAEASECAAEQGWFWPFHDMLYTNQTGEAVGDFIDRRLKVFAVDLSLDKAKFNSCFDSGKYQNVVAADLIAARQNGVTGTPTIIIPGSVPLSGAQDYSVYQQAIDAALAAAGG
ncbi:MAG: thioredoxin domain-containing protein [Chloroflexi bacterium]|nr:thioredoxin domain-containing protein [Chloroflexota bacterium]